MELHVTTDILISHLKDFFSPYQTTNVGSMLGHCLRRQSWKMGGNLLEELGSLFKSGIEKNSFSTHPILEGHVTVIPQKMTYLPCLGRQCNQKVQQ